MHSEKTEGASPKQFQEKCATVFRPELRKNKKKEHFQVPVGTGNALWKRLLWFALLWAAGVLCVTLVGGLIKLVLT